ncbi:PTS glucose transporter subunit IIA [Lactobacillus sp. R2/2]|nr:PTS glucose transporter subunit IIA [Lactobacillus sp. R2/2]
MVWQKAGEKEDLTVTAPISGKLEKIEEVNDPAFAQKMLGMALLLSLKKIK